MKLVLAIFKKDTRRFWPLLLLWAAVLIAGIGVSAGVIALPTDLYGNSRLGTAFHFFEGIGALVFALVVVALVHEDALVGDRQFWMTRPVGARALAAAKLLDVAVWLLLPSAVIYAGGALWLRASLGQLLSGELTWLVYLGSYAAFLLALAALTSTIVQLATVLGGIGLVVFVLGLNRNLYWYTGFSYRIGLRHSGASNQMAILIALGLLGCASVVFQGQRRRRSQTILFLMAGLLALPLSPFLWLFPPLGEKPRETTPAGQIGFQAVGTRAMTDSKNGITHTYVAASYQIAGGAKDRHLSADVEKSKFQTSPGLFAWRQEDPNGLFINGQSDPEATLGWEAARPSTSLVWSDYPKDYPAYAGHTGSLKSSFSINEQRRRILAEFPFRDNAEFRGQGIYFRLSRNMIQSYVQGKKTIKRNWMGFEYHFINAWSHELTVYVINRSRREIACVRDLSNDQDVWEDGWSKITAVNGQLYLDPQQSMPDYRLAADDITDHWLEGATIVLVDSEFLGSTEKTLEIADFVMPAPAANPPK